MSVFKTFTHFHFQASHQVKADQERRDQHLTCGHVGYHALSLSLSLSLTHTHTHAHTHTHTHTHTSVRMYSLINHHRTISIDQKELLSRAEFAHQHVNS